MTNPPNPTPDRLPAVEIPPDLAIQYANLVRIAHSPSEMVFDFARMLPGSGGPVAVARVVMTPLSAKLFLRALSENLGRYETAFGAVRIPGEPTLAEDLFRPPETK